MNAPTRKTDFAKVFETAKGIQNLYSEKDVRLPPECTLAMWIENARTVVERRALDPTAGHTHMEHFKGVQLYRVADAILALRDVDGGERYLRKITDNLDFFDSERSPAKDIFWELELWWMVRRQLPTARLVDPPDILIDLNGGTIGLACKAVYSEASVERALSTGVKQVTGNCDAGVVAFNIDSRVPADRVFHTKDKAGLDGLLHPIIDGFVGRHRRHFDRYLNEQRLAAVVVCVSGVGDIYGWSVPFNTIRSVLVYAASKPTKVAERLLIQFRDILVLD